MTYRFACGAFWAAFALANVNTPSSLGSLGVVKGLLLRHLRWWSRQPEIFNADGTMNIGFAYPNMYLSEDYNSRQSVYWCLKSFVILGLPPSHLFWKISEEPHPMAISPLDKQFHAGYPDLIKVFHPAHHILCNSLEHHYLLSAGQMTTKMFKGREAKYGKFAYSSAFGFSVPTGSELHQLAPDSTLAVSLDDGDTWKVRWKPFDVCVESVSVGTEEGCHDIPAITSTWKPFSHLDLKIRTTLIPLSSYYPGWHTRVHQVQGIHALVSIPWCQNLQLVDSSFALPALTKSGYHVPKRSGDDSFIEGFSVEPSSIHIKSRNGASGIIDLTPDVVLNGKSHQTEPCFKGEGHLIEADPNTNLIAQKTYIPSIKYSYRSIQKAGSTSTEALESIIFATAVFGVSSANIDQAETVRMWNKRPNLEVDNDGSGKMSVKII